MSSPGAPSSSWTETRPRRPLLQPVNRVEREDRAAIPASPPARRPGFFRSLASSGGSPAIRVPRPYRSRLQQHRDHSHTRCPLLPARCPHRWRAPGAQSSPACAPPPLRPLPCPLPHNPRRGVAAPTDPPKPTPCRAPPSQGSTPAPGQLKSPQPGLQTRSNFRAQPRESGRLTARFPQVKHPPRRLHLLRAGRGCRQFCPLGFQELQGRHRVRPPGLRGGRPPEWKSPLPLHLGALPASGARSFPNPLRVSVAHPLTDARPPGSNPADSSAEPPGNAVTVQARHPLRTDSGLLPPPRSRPPCAPRAPRRPGIPGLSASPEGRRSR